MGICFFYLHHFSYYPLAPGHSTSKNPMRNALEKMSNKFIPLSVMNRIKAHWNLYPIHPHWKYEGAGIFTKDKDTRSICNNTPSVTWGRYKSAKVFKLLTFCQNCIFLTRECCISIKGDSRNSNYAKDLRLKSVHLSDN